MDEPNKTELHWEEGTPMSKEYALAVIQSLKHFARHLYFFPKAEPFNGEADYKAHISELNGLKDYVESQRENE